MDNFSVNAPLSPDEFVALNEVSKGAGQRIIPAAIKKRLLELRLIEEALGGLKLTMDGTMRLRLGT